MCFVQRYSIYSFEKSLTILNNMSKKMSAEGFPLLVQKRHVNDDDSTLTEQTKYQSPQKTNKKHKAFPPSSNPMSQRHGSHNSANASNSPSSQGSNRSSSSVSTKSSRKEKKSLVLMS